MTNWNVVQTDFRCCVYFLCLFCCFHKNQNIEKKYARKQPKRLELKKKKTMRLWKSILKINNKIEKINWHIHCQFIWDISKYRSCCETEEFLLGRIEIIFLWVEPRDRKTDNVTFTTAYITLSFSDFGIFSKQNCKCATHSVPFANGSHKILQAGHGGC